MNAYEIVGLMHLFAMSVSMVSVVAIFILKRQKIISLTPVNLKIMILAGSDMIISIMYFLIDYYSAITGNAGVNALVRIADAWITVSLQYIWFLLIKNLIFNEEKTIFWAGVKVIYIVLLAINFINYGIIMDEYYYIEDRGLRHVSAIFEVSEMVVTVVINIILICRIIYRGIKSEYFQTIRMFCVVGSAAILAESCQGAYVGVRLISGMTTLYNYNPDSINITSTARLVLAGALLWYVAKNCILAQYQKAPEDAIKDDLSIRIEKISADRKLTEREAVVVKLLYEGSTYRDIAEYLYISVNTVKHHITNIYKKLDVSSKMEMINLIRKYDSDSKGD